jgi:multiple sugar transport system permease protein
MATVTAQPLPAAPARREAKVGSQAMPTPFRLKAATAAVLTIWVLLAAFPLFWILVMSFKLPVDAFSSDPLDVVIGPRRGRPGRA